VLAVGLAARRAIRIAAGYANDLLTGDLALNPTPLLAGYRRA
jgi:hypothetical protein